MWSIQVMARFGLDDHMCSWQILYYLKSFYLVAYLRYEFVFLKCYYPKRLLVICVIEF